MTNSFLTAIAGALGALVVSGFAATLALFIRVAVMNEKMKYQSGQIRQLLRRSKMISETDASSDE